jgi:hypothetical protein
MWIIILASLGINTFLIGARAFELRTRQGISVVERLSASSEDVYPMELLYEEVI